VFGWRNHRLTGGPTAPRRARGRRALLSNTEICERLYVSMSTTRRTWPAA